MNAPATPLECFLRDYAEIRGGLWEQVEPQVYDLLLADPAPAGGNGGGAPVVRVVLDPEALPEHQGCRFLGPGTPLLEELLESAHGGARSARAWLVGLGRAPADLAGHLRRSLDLEPQAKLRVHAPATMEFATLVHWFQATYVGDEKEHETFIVAVDAADGRQVRHLDRLVDWSRLQEAPFERLPEAPRLSPRRIYGLARDRVVRSLSSAANARSRELAARFARQEARMLDYYAALNAEIDEQIARARRRNEDPARPLARRAAVARERQRRLAELKQKRGLRVRLALTNLLEVRQPKLLIDATLEQRPQAGGARGRGGTAPPVAGTARVALRWDPLVQSLEAPVCSGCRRPTFAPRLSRGRSTWCCPACAAPRLRR